MLEADVMVKVADVEVPEDGTLPVPVQPVQTYWPAGEVTEAVTLEPESNQLPGGGGEGVSYADDTVR